MAIIKLFFYLYGKDVILVSGSEDIGRVIKQLNLKSNLSKKAVVQLTKIIEMQRMAIPEFSGVVPIGGKYLLFGSERMPVNVLHHELGHVRRFKPKFWLSGRKWLYTLPLKSTKLREEKKAWENVSKELRRKFPGVEKLTLGTYKGSIAKSKGKWALLASIPFAVGYVGWRKRKERSDKGKKRRPYRPRLG